MAKLVSCSACSRHVRVTDARCPFCLSARTASDEGASPNAPALSRAALLFASAATVAACGKTPAPPDPPKPQPVDTGNMAVPAYGVPLPPDVPTAAPDADAPDTTDAGAAADAGRAKDAGAKAKK